MSRGVKRSHSLGAVGEAEAVVGYELRGEIDLCVMRTQASSRPIAHVPGEVRRTGRIT